MDERIFISYKRVDKERVFAIKDGIEQATGEKCWIDLEGIESDAQFANVIIKAINRCEVFLFMYSKEHANIIDFDTDWTIREINFAQKKRKRIVFINIDNTPLTDWFEMLFGTKQQVDAADSEKLVRLYKDISSWLKSDVCNQAKREALPEGAFQVGDLMYKASKNSNGVTVCGRYNRNAYEIHIPAQIKFGKYTYIVDAIGKDAFCGRSNMTSITIPNSVTTIEEYAFNDCCNLTSIVIPDSVTCIGKSAFRGCSSLRFVDIPQSITHIGDDAFPSDTIIRRMRPEEQSITHIGNDAFPSETIIRRKRPEETYVQEVQQWIDQVGLRESSYDDWDIHQLTDAICGPNIIQSLKLPNLDQANSDGANKQECQRYLAYLGNFPTDKQISIMLDAFKTQLDDKIHALLQEIDGIYNALRFVEIFKTYCERFKTEMDSEVESLTKQKAEREDAFDKKAYSNYISEKHGALTFGRATKNQELLEDLVGRPARKILQLTYEIKRREVASSIYNTLIAQADELSEKLENMDGSLQ